MERTWTRVGAMCLVLAVGGCAKETSAPPPLAVSDSALLGTAQSGAHNKPVGGDCTAGRTSDCASGLCVKGTFDFDAGYYCSKECASVADCPSALWACVEAMPGPHGRICTPATIVDGGTSP